METARLTLMVIAAVASGLVAGIFLIFSITVMAALRRLPPAFGMAAMQHVNAIIQNVLFLGLFLGTALVSVILAVTAIMRWGEDGMAYLLVGSLLYLIGAFGVTVVCNVPRNNALAAVDANDPVAVDVWATYVAEWTMWNHVRAIANIGATICFVLAIVAM